MTATIATTAQTNPFLPPSLRPDLTVRIDNITLPDTVEFGDTGQVQVTITNTGHSVARGLHDTKLYISTDNNIDSNDAVLTTVTTNLNLQPGRSITVNLPYASNTSVIAQGAYNLIAQIDSGNAIAETNENNNIVSQQVSAPGTDQVIKWNAVALNAIQAEGEANRGVPPTEGSRLLAILSTAIYDTVNSFERTNTPYLVDKVAPSGASLEAAVVGAAEHVLSTLLPNQKNLFSSQSESLLAQIQDGDLAEIKGRLFGRSIAEQFLAARANDGSDNNAPYVAPDGDYVWRTDPPNFIAVGSNWGSVTPFAIPSVDEFKATLATPLVLDGTPTTNSALYAQEIEEVRKFGGKQNTAVTTLERTADQTEIAVFWAYDRQDTFRPYGQLNQLTETIALQAGNTLSENARLFAALNVALADAAIVAWDTKYKFTQPRPDDVIAGGIAANDGLASTVADPNWQPLLPTPPFPDYISGHSTFAGAWAGVLTEFFGDNYQFSGVSQELPGVIRNFDSFEEAAFEDAISRVYGGVHVREATITDALPAGLAVGTFVAENLFQPIANSVA
jgi:hypothetical protein